MAKVLGDLLNSTISRDRWVFGWPSLGGGSPEPEPVLRVAGFSASHDEGIFGTLFVSPSGSDTTGTGSSSAPFRTIAKARAEGDARGGIWLMRLRGGVYRESIDMSGLTGNAVTSYFIGRYGTEEVIISGFENVTGWEQCTAADEAVLGPRFAQIYKRTVSTASLPDGQPMAANIHEDGQRLKLASGKGFNPQYTWTDTALADWMVAPDVTTIDVEVETPSGPQIQTKLTGYVFPDLVAKYTEAQLSSASVTFHASPNSAYATTIESITGDTITLADKSRTYETNSNKNRFVLLNLLPAMKIGGWGFKDNGDGTTTLYVRPNNPANLTSKIEVSARTTGINLRNTSYARVRGLIFEGFACDGTRADGKYTVSAANTATAPFRTDIEVSNNWLRKSWRGYDGYGCAFWQNVANFHFIGNTIDDAVGQFGLFSFGSHHTDPRGLQPGNRILYNLISRCDKAPVRVYGNQLGIVGGNVFIGTGQASHANKGNLYEGGRYFLWHRNAWFGCDGYLAQQETSSMHVFMNFIPGGYAGGATGFRDQNNDTPSPSEEYDVDETSYLANNAIAPYKDALSSTDSIFLGTAAEDHLFWAVHNNIIHGSSLTNAKLESWSHNISTIGPTKGDGDQTLSLGQVWTTVSTGNLVIPETSPIWSAPAAPLTEIVEALEALFPDYPDLRLDLFGRPFNPASGFIGPYQRFSDQLPHPPFWVEAPGITGLAVVGQTLSITTGYVTGYPRPGNTRRWVVSFDDWDTYSQVGIGTTFTVTSAQLGGKIGLISSANGVECFRQLDNVVTSGYPLGNPVTIKEAVFAGNATSYSVPDVTFTGAPALLIINSRNGVTTSDNVYSISTPAGTFVATAAKARRGPAEGQVFFCAAPTPGTHSIDVTGTLTTNSAMVHVVEVSGLASVGLLGTGGSSSATSWAQSVTTTQASSGVMFLFNRMDGSLSAPITLSGHEVAVYNKNTLDSVTGQITAAAGYKPSPSIGSYSIGASWGAISAQSFWLAAELKA